MILVIRQYHRDDVSKIVRLLQRCGQRMTENEFDRMLDEPGERIRENTFVAVLGDTIVGCIRLCFVQTDEPGHVHVFSFGEVDPEQRRKGIGTLLYQHAIRHLHQMAEQEDCRFTLRQTVDAENVDQRKVLERTGFMLTSSLSTMRLTKARLSKTHLTQDGDSLLTSDDGFHIRPTTQEDAADCARLYNAAFSWRASPTLMSRESILYEMSAPDYVPSLYPILVNDRGTAVGYAHASLIEEGDTKSGKIHTVAVHPEYQGRGLGKQLLCYCISTLKSMGATTITLSVESDNPTNAIPLYCSIGFEAYKEWFGYSLTIGPRDDGKLRDGDKSSRKD